MEAWSAAALEGLDGAHELEIAAGNAAPVPIWVVTVGGQVYVRSWHRRDTGWFGAAIAGRRARIRVPGLQADVDITDVGAGDEDLRRSVDDAYRAKYGPAGAESMVTEGAAATTLRLDVSSTAPSAP